MKTYCIKDGYTIRTDLWKHKDAKFKDEYQNEVYEFAKLLCVENNLTTVADIGTGSGYKLLKYFHNYDTTGTDLPFMVEWLKEKYPERKWLEYLERGSKYDLIIASDVIEHVEDPDTILELIKLHGSKYFILSTPERDLVGRGLNGPPSNLSHVREWNKEEFYNYISLHFNVLEHIISNHKQCTQLILGTVN